MHGETKKETNSCDILSGTDNPYLPNFSREQTMTNTFPVIHSILSHQALVTEVLPDFNIGDIAACRFFSGGFNDTYLVKTMQGSTYYLRAYRLPWRTLPDIQCELAALNHLHRKGYPAARPLATTNGDYFHFISAPEGTRYVALFTEASGPEISYEKEPEKVAYNYGQAVACLHTALDDFSSPHQRFHKGLDHLIDKPLRNIEPFLEHRPGDWAYLQSFAVKVRQRILDLPASTLEQGYCHGDLQGYHANIGPDGTLTFFDFDCGGFGYRAYDLAVFLWCCRLEEAVDARWESYLRGYQDVRLIHQIDLQAIPLFVCTRYLWHMGVHTQNAPDWGCGWLNDKYFDNRLKQLRDIEADYQIE
jgi:Ser/Thr protein kinase RdoA (MazF antagonist)